MNDTMSAPLLVEFARLMVAYLLYAPLYSNLYSNSLGACCNLGKRFTSMLLQVTILFFSLLTIPTKHSTSATLMVHIIHPFLTPDSKLTPSSSSSRLCFYVTSSSPSQFYSTSRFHRRLAPQKPCESTTDTGPRNTSSTAMSPIELYFTDDLKSHCWCH